MPFGVCGGASVRGCFEATFTMGQTHSQGGNHQTHTFSCTSVSSATAMSFKLLLAFFCGPYFCGGASVQGGFEAMCNRGEKQNHTRGMSQHCRLWCFAAALQFPWLFCGGASQEVLKPHASGRAAAAAALYSDGLFYHRRVWCCGVALCFCGGAS